MGQVREIEPEITDADISNAIIETEKEIAGAAWGDEETEAADPTGDRSLESLGEGLEGQHEDEETDGEEDAEGEESEGEDGEDEGEGEDAEEQPLAASQKADGEPKPEGHEDAPRGRVPAGRLREANERARAAEAERDQLRQQIETRAQNPEIEALKAQVSTLTQLLQRQPQPAPQPKAEAPAIPDIFENPQGFVEHITNQIRSEMGAVRQDLKGQSVETSFRIAHVKHGEAFPKAMEAINRLDANNPDDRATVQRIYNSPDPGEALVSWHKRNETLARVGSDPAAYEERIRRETREALMKDPEFTKQLLASLRAEASQGNDGRPNTTIRLPTSVGRAAGSNLGATREHYGAMDDSDQAVADSAWR